MEQTRALNALQPYLALSKSATSPRAAADVITQATSAQNTYVFAELLSTPAVQNLKTTSEEQYKSHYQLLEIFAWGTWADYTAHPSALPQLNDQQKHKLLLLTLLTLASTAPSSSALTYSHLTASLGLTSTRELEKLVTDAVYNDLLTGTLDSKSQLVIVSSVAPLRDLAPGSLGSMIKELEAWSQRCENVLGDLEAEVDKVRKNAGERAQRNAVLAAQLHAAETKHGGSGAAAAGVGGPGLGSGGRALRSGNSAAFADNTWGSRGGGAFPLSGDGEDEDLMDVDDAPAAGRGKKGARGTAGAARRNR